MNAKKKDPPIVAQFFLRWDIFFADLAIVRILYILRLVSGNKTTYYTSRTAQTQGVTAIERMPKRQRQQELAQAIKDNPFITDEELTKLFRVSIQTIRLDRLELGIPELRERIKLMAESYDEVRSLPLSEVIGEVIDLQLDKSGISMFEIKEEHVFSRTQIARGHHIFSQANSLAVAIINDEIALTASAELRFIRSVKLHEKNASPKLTSDRNRKAKLKWKC